MRWKSALFRVAEPAAGGRGCGLECGWCAGGCHLAAGGQPQEACRDGSTASQQMAGQVGDVGGMVEAVGRVGVDGILNNSEPLEVVQRAFSVVAGLPGRNKMAGEQTSSQAGVAGLVLEADWVDVEGRWMEGGGRNGWNGWRGGAGMD